jgi:hypothetical protein
MVSLLFLSLYTHFKHPWIDLEKCLKDPERYHGREVTDFREPRIGEIKADGFILNQRNGSSIFVKADTTGLEQGAYIGLIARFHKDGYLKAIKYRIAKKRKMKIVISIIPVIIVAILLITSFRIDMNTLSIKPYSKDTI